MKGNFAASPRISTGPYRRATTTSTVGAWGSLMLAASSLLRRRATATTPIWPPALSWGSAWETSNRLHCTPTGNGLNGLAVPSSEKPLNTTQLLISHSSRAYTGLCRLIDEDIVHHRYSYSDAWYPHRKHRHFKTQLTQSFLY